MLQKCRFCVGRVNCGDQSLCAQRPAHVLDHQKTIITFKVSMKRGQVGLKKKSTCEIIFICITWSADCGDYIVHKFCM